MEKTILILLLIGSHFIGLPQIVNLEINEEGALFSEGQDSVLYYNRTPHKHHGPYKRSNYIHPLYTLDGQILTQDAPADHPHHHGVFWAWHQLYLEDQRIGDAWEIKDVNWDVIYVEEQIAAEKAKSIKTTVIWNSPLVVDDNGNRKPLVTEKTLITVFPAEQNYRMVDLRISLIANQGGIKIGGSENEKGYGGFSARIRLSDDVKFRGPDGKVIPKLLPVTSEGWIDISGAMGLNDSYTGLAILSHPTNPGYPNPWILRSKESMQNAVYPHPGATAIELSHVNPTVLRYRIIIHNGLTSKKMSSIHKEYAEKR